MTTPALVPKVSGVDVLQPPSSERSNSVRTLRPLALPLAFTLALLAFPALPSIRANPTLLWSLLGTCTLLFAWNAALSVNALRHRRTLSMTIALHKQHYLQACAQGAVLLYWGWYWRQVYDSAELIAAQLLFAYAFDMLLTWSRRDTFTLGFGPFPIIFSINLFLWFKPDWFYLQFLMVAVGFAAKEFIRWNKEGRPAHVFNPSSFPLGLFSLVLLMTGATQMTWGQEIATTLFAPPNIYLMIFLVGLPGQFFFGVTTMTMSAVVTTYLIGLAYYAATGSYFFFDAYIPIADFLGMHLLFTDPSTSPRTEWGRIIFGILYGLAVVLFATLLGFIGAPTFYDKLLPVPILNLSIKGIDRIARSNVLKRLDPGSLGRSLTPRRRNLAYMSIWASVFIVLSAVEGVGDTHEGHRIPFWQEACREGRVNGCRNLLILESTFCNEGSGWACNELGIHLIERSEGGTGAQPSFVRSCDLGFLAGCDNFRISNGLPARLRRLPPRLDDYRILAREGKAPLIEHTPLDVYERVCAQGWASGCNDVAELYSRGEWTSRDPARASDYQRKACALGFAEACTESSEGAR